MPNLKHASESSIQAKPMAHTKSNNPKKPKFPTFLPNAVGLATSNCIISAQLARKLDTVRALSLIPTSQLCRWSLQALAVMRVMGEEIFLKLVKLGNQRQGKIRRVGLGKEGVCALIGHYVGIAGNFCAFFFPVATN
jgi:hypothetical protein